MLPSASADAPMLAIEYRALDDLHAYEANSRTHSPAQLGQIGRSMRTFGWTNPVLVDERGGVIAGHGRIEAARALWAEGIAFPRCPVGQVPVVVLVGLSEAERRALVIADNRIAENAGWDIKLLSQELRDLKLGGEVDIGLLGFRADELHALLRDPLVAGSGDVEDAPAPRAEAVSVLGDVWLLGDHRVICGDSTDVGVFDALLAGERADVVWTDPPYNVAYSSKLAGAIQNDDMEASAFRQFLTDAFVAVSMAMRPGASIYVAHSDTEGLNFRAAFAEAGFKLSGCVIWRKDSLVLGRSDFQWQHEPILYGWKPGAAHRWFGGRKMTTIAEWGSAGPVTQRADGSWVITVGDTVLVVEGGAYIEEGVSSLINHPKPRRSAEHPTMKPVSLVERFLRLSARAGDVVLDAFGGSGSTLMAAEVLAMRARLVELDPVFVDVIVRRWSAFTGRDAIHAETGRSFAQMDQPRAISPPSKRTH